MKYINPKKYYIPYVFMESNMAINMNVYLLDMDIFLIQYHLL